MPGGNIGNSFQMALKGDIVSLKVAAATRIYRGSLVAVVGGYATAASDTANHTFLGIAEEQSDNTAGIAGAREVRVRRHGLAVLTKNAATLVTDVGALVYAEAGQTNLVDQTVDIAGAGVVNSVRVGRVLKRLPDTDNGSTYLLKKLLVDITPGA